MGKRRLVRLSITEAEAITLIVALSEYLYLQEEGDVDEALDELDLREGTELLPAAEAAELKGRLEALLG